jgi:hypothetical protein
MLISYSHKFIFVHNYKVAGTSVRNAFSKYQPWYYQNKCAAFFLKCFEKYIPHYKAKVISDHATAGEIKNSLPPEVFEGFYKFGFVRNPWDWQVSLYHYMRKEKTHYQHNLIKKMDFEAYLDWRVKHDRHLQKDFFTDKKNNLIVDYIGKIENLREDFQQVCSRVNLVGIDLPHINRSNHKGYKTYYNDRLVKLVESNFKEDIEFFNYTFD